MFEQLTYADRAIYQGSPVEAQLVFCWGHSSDIWDQFDVAEAREFHKLLVNYAGESQSHPPTQPIDTETTTPSSVTSGVNATSPMPIGIQPVGVQPGVNAKPNISGTAQPIGVQPVGVQPGINAKPNTLAHLEDLLTNQDISTLVTALRAASNGLLGEEVRSDLNRLAEVLEHYQQQRGG